jgi:hypothetical protein
MPYESVLSQAIGDATFTYTPRPDPVLGDLRMSWGIAILLIALLYSRGKKSNLQKLQFLAHAVRLDEGRQEVRGLLRGEYRAADVAVRVEPWLNRAISFAHALHLVSVSGGTSVSLSQRGLKLATEVAAKDDLLKVEREFLKEVSPKVTDALMRRVWRLEDLL